MFVFFGDLVKHFVGVGNHGAEFVHAEDVAVFADALLAEEDGAGGGEFDEEGGGDEDGGEEK